MFKKLLFLLLAALLLFTTSSAQEVKKTGGFARLSGMGANPFVIDPFFVTVNPAWGAAYNNFVSLDLGVNTGAAFSPGGSGQFLAGSFSLNKKLTIGAMLTRNDFNGIGISLVDPGTNNGLGIPFPGVVSTVNSIVPGAVIPMDNNVELMGTYTIKKRTSIGFGVAYARTSRDLNPPTGESTEGSASQIGFNAGVLHTFSKKLFLDAGVSFILPSASYKPPTAGASETKASQTIILVNARAFYNYSKKLSFVPIVTFMTASGTVESGGANSVSSDLVSGTMFAVGIGANYKVKDFLLAGGVTFSSISSTTPSVNNVSPELKSSATSFPVWNFGIEWNMIEWLVARLGYVAVTSSASVESAASTTTVSEAVFTFFLPQQRGATVGIGFRFGDFSLDAVVNEDVIRQGFNNIGGGGPTFAYLSASYAMP